MKVLGLDGLSPDELNFELGRGGRFVIFEYCISLIAVTFKRSSNIYFVRSGGSVLGKAFGFSLVSLLLGWWGIPWGPIYTISSLLRNLRGGTDVTSEVVASLSDSGFGDEKPDQL